MLHAVRTRKKGVPRCMGRLDAPARHAILEWPVASLTPSSGCTAIIPGMAGFIDIRMPLRICAQFSGGPSFATSLARARSGYAKANIDRPDAIWKYEASNFLKDDDLRILMLAFMLALQGQGNTCRFRDMGHYWTGCQHYGGRGDIVPLLPANVVAFATQTGAASTFQLYVPYPVANIITTQRKITKPAKISDDNPGYTGPRFWVNDVLVDPAHWALNYSTGLVTFDFIPAPAATIKWAGLFDVHARMQDDDTVLALADTPEAADHKIKVIEEQAA